VLALTLSFASNRFNERRHGTLVEANAIGTAWLRAVAGDQPRGDEIVPLIEQYTQVRLDFIRTGDEHAAAIVQEHPRPVATWLASSLNDAFDASTDERFGFAMKLPSQIFWLIVGLSGWSMGVVGDQLGLKGGTIRTMILLLTVVWTVVIVDILDLAAGRFGNFHDPGAYEWALQGFKGGLKIPPLLCSDGPFAHEIDPRPP